MTLYVFCEVDEEFSQCIVGRSRQSVLSPFMQRVKGRYSGATKGVSDLERNMLGFIQKGQDEEAFALYSQVDTYNTGIQRLLLPVDLPDSTPEVFVAVHWDGERLDVFVDPDEEKAAELLATHLQAHGSKALNVQKVLQGYWDVYEGEPLDPEEYDGLAMGSHTESIGFLNETATEGIFEVSGHEVL